MARLNVKNLIHLAVPAEARNLATDTETSKKHSIIKSVATGVGVVAGAAVGFAVVMNKLKNEATTDSTENS